MQRFIRHHLWVAVLLIGGPFAHALQAEEAAWPQRSIWQALPSIQAEPLDPALSAALGTEQLIIRGEAETVTEIHPLEESESPQLVEAPAATVEAEDEAASAAKPQAPSFSLFGAASAKRESESASIPKVPEDIFAEFESLAFWTGMMVLVIVAGLFILKYRFPELQGLKTNDRLQKIAHLQLRPDAQLWLVQADDQRYIVALDRQGIKTLQSISAWSEVAENTDHDLLSER